MTSLTYDEYSRMEEARKSEWRKKIKEEATQFAREGKSFEDVGDYLYTSPKYYGYSLYFLCFYLHELEKIKYKNA